MPLQFLDANNDPTPLREWADDLIKIGKKSWRHQKAGSRIVIGLSLPTINYSSSLIAYGAVKEALKSDLSDGNKSNLSFDALCEMIGASVSFKDIAKSKKGQKIVLRKGIISGTETFQGRPRLDVKFKVTKKMVQTKAFYPETTGELSLINEEITDDDLKGKGTTLGKSDRRLFVSGLLNTNQLNQLYSISKTGIWIVDNKRRFKDEVEGESFSIRDEHGCLGEIIRPDFISQYENSSKASFISSTNNNTLKDVEEEPSIAILAGARAIVRNLIDPKAKCTIAIIDRNESNCREAEEVLNNQFQSRSDDFSIQDLSEINHLSRTIAFKY